VSAKQRRLERLKADADSGKIQALVDQGWTILQLAKKYEVSESSVRKVGMSHGGPVRFNYKQGVKSQAVPMEHWSDAKRLALTARW